MIAIRFELFYNQVMTKAQKITYYILLVLMTALFLFTGYDKLSGDRMAVSGFAAVGLPLWFMYAIGILEILGAVGLWFKGLFRYAYEGLFVILIGAILTTVVFMGPVLAILPLVVAIVLGVIVWLHSKGLPGAAK